MTNDATLQDELLIRRLVERWAVWRDAGAQDAAAGERKRA
jgi:hypothetical protein